MTPRPAVAATTDRLYDRLPQLYRDADEAQDDWPLLRYLSLVVDQAGELEELLARLDYDDTNPDDTSDLGDPATADDAWLPWMGQLVGIGVADTTGAELREAVATASAGFIAGTRDGIAAAARTALTGSRYVIVRPNFTGDPWKVEVRTRTSETPSSPAVLDAIERKRARPAGVEIVHTSYSATWATLEADRPTWADWAAPWVDIEETGAP